MLSLAAEVPVAKAGEVQVAVQGQRRAPAHAVVCETGSAGSHTATGDMPHPQRCNKSHTWGMSKGHVQVRACRIPAGGHARQCLCFGFAAAQWEQAQKGGRAQAWGQAAIFRSRWQPAFMPQPRPPSNHIFCTHPRGLGLAARVTRRRARHVRYFGCLECV